VEDNDFGVDFLARNLNKLQNLGLKGKISQVSNVFTIGLMAHVKLINCD
jgi:hypothetical protein